VVVSQVFGLKANNCYEMIEWQDIVKRTSSSSCFSRSPFFLSSPSRTRLEALFRSAARMATSPLPSLVFPASSKTRPDSALSRCACVKLSAGFKDPDSSFVWTKRWRRASFWAFELKESVREKLYDVKDSHILVIILCVTMIVSM
jgi:hypothetical protein